MNFELDPNEALPSNNNWICNRGDLGVNLLTYLPNSNVGLAQQLGASLVLNC